MVRKATERDIPALLKLLEQVNLVHHEGRPDLFRRVTKYDANALRQILSNPDAPIFVYEDANGAVLGHAMCHVKRAENDRLLCDRTTLYIDDFCVDRNAQRQGIGKAIYAFTEAYAREIGCYNVTLTVWSFNRGAYAFYEQLGMVPQQVRMERILTPED